MTRSMFPSSVASHVAGAWLMGGGATTNLQDKFSREPIGCVNHVSDDEVVAAAQASSRAVVEWKATPYERGLVLRSASDIVLSQREQLQDVMAAEAGFTAADANGEIERCVQTLRLCAEEATRLGGEVVPMEGAPGQAGRVGFTMRAPVGVVCAITPFNSPLNTVAHKVAPALAAGNAVILKPSQYTPVTANILTQALLDAGLPPAQLSVLHGDAHVAQRILARPEVAFVAFTGSKSAGRAIQGQIGLRRSQMELGSIAYTIVDESADIERAVPRIVAAAYRKAGQVCTSIQTLLVHRRRLDEVTQRLQVQVAALKYGDPRQRDCQVGPLISEESARRVAEWVESAIGSGAMKLVGAPRQGSVVPPTLLCGTNSDMQVRCQEVFGPVMSIVGFDGFDEALDVVNSTPYGLATGVFTDTLAHAWQAAKVLAVGAVHVNEASSSRADLMPFGGMKESGFGREGPRYAIREMTVERLITFA